MLKVKLTRWFGFLALVGALAPMAIAPSWAATGLVSVEIAKAGFIVGIGGGRGTLTFKGRKYPFKVGGLSFGATIGASKSNLVGHAFNLHQASDIAGNYSAVAAGVAVA